MKTGRYIWQQQQWPQLRWDDSALSGTLARTAETGGRLLGELGMIGLEAEALRAERVVAEALSTASIEGEALPPASVRSSVAHRLGLNDGAPTTRHDVQGLVDVLLDATTRSSEDLTDERLFGWHAALFPTGHSGIRRIAVGRWREGPVRVMSGRVGAEQIHFEGPPSSQIPTEMRSFLIWWASSTTLAPAMRAGVAHAWFETIHPFEDGNGRIGRAIADMALAGSSGRRAFSLSEQILADRRAYYEALQRMQGGDLDITMWLRWFLDCVRRAMESSRRHVHAAVRKSQLHRLVAGAGLNARQRKVLVRLLEAGPGGFEGGLSNRKYGSIAKTSRATATRDLGDLVSRGLLISSGGGRSTRYQFNWGLLDSP